MLIEAMPSGILDQMDLILKREFADSVKKLKSKLVPRAVIMKRQFADSLKKWKSWFRVRLKRKRKTKVNATRIL